MSFAGCCWLNGERHQAHNRCRFSYRGSGSIHVRLYINFLYFLSCSIDVLKGNFEFCTDRVTST